MTYAFNVEQMHRESCLRYTYHLINSDLLSDIKISSTKIIENNKGNYGIYFD